MELSTEHPDNDRLVQFCFQWDLFYRKLFTVREEGAEKEWGQSEIEEIQDICFDACVSICTVFGVDENTKLHRTMRHLKTHIEYFGFIRVVSTEENESINEDLKKGYYLTNKHMHRFSLQLLKGRVEKADEDGCDSYSDASDSSDELDRQTTIREGASHVEDD